MRALLTWRNIGWLVLSVILPAVLSAYGPEVRRLLGALRRKPRQVVLARLKYRLRLLETLHDSPYQLFLHFMWNVVFVAEFALAYVVTIGVLRLFRPGFTSSFAVMIWAGIYGRILALSGTIYALYEYDEATTKLRARIAKLTGQPSE